MSEQLTSITPEREWAAFAAIDWADQKNFWRLLPAGSRRSEAAPLNVTVKTKAGVERKLTIPIAVE